MKIKSDVSIATEDYETGNQRMMYGWNMHGGFQDVAS